MEWNEEDIAYVIEHLRVPESLVEEEFIAWLQQPEKQKIFEAILLQRAAFLCREDCAKIDTEAEYWRFMHKNRSARRDIWRRWMVGVASIVVVLGTLLLLWGRTDRDTDLAGMTQEYTGRKMAELTLANGQKVALERDFIELQEKNGIRIVNDSNCQLAYQQHVVEEHTGKELVYNTLRIPSGADYVVCLSDGTKVRLNCESEFRFPVTFSEKERKVYLKGEAFFEVSKAKEWPFVVVTDKMEVQVTGTRFNVCAYPEDEIAATTLVSGEVKICSDSYAGQEIKLTPAQQFRLDKNTGRTEVKEVDVQLYIGWIDGMFVFRNQRLEEVMEQLARWYSIKVFYLQASVKDLRLSANLGRYEHIDNLLQIIQAVDKIQVERKGNVVTLDWK